MATKEEIQRDHPEWNVVDVVDAPGGGQWAVGADGGVFALGGAQFGGGYTTLAPEGRQGTRSFTGITLSEGGYTLRSDLGESYRFFTPTAPVTPPPANNATGTNTAADVKAPDESGRDIFINTLVTMGFTRDQAQSLGGNIWTNSKTKSQDALYFDVIGSNEYKQRFPGMQALRDQGIAISEGEYVRLERSYKAVARSAGLPENFYDSPEDFGKLIAGGVSPEEYGARVQWAQTTALSDPTFIEELQRQVPGANLGDATAFFLDPARGTQQLEQKMVRAQTGAAARRSGFGSLSDAELNTLEGRGVSAQQATERFDLLGSQSGLIANTVGETMTGDHFTREEQLSTVTDPTGQGMQEMETRRRRRAANFQGGGGAASGGGGRTGLG